MYRLFIFNICFHKIIFYVYFPSQSSYIHIFIQIYYACWLCFVFHNLYYVPIKSQNCTIASSFKETFWYILHTGLLISKVLFTKDCMISKSFLSHSNFVWNQVLNWIKPSKDCSIASIARSSSQLLYRWIPDCHRYDLQRFFGLLRLLIGFEFWNECLWTFEIFKIIPMI